MPGESLPKGYKRTKVGIIPGEWNEGAISAIARVNPRTDTSHLKGGTLVSFIPMENIGEEGKVRAMETRPYAEVRNGYTIFADGDILFAKITPCMENGKGALVKGLENGVGFGSTEFHVLRPINPKDTGFIYQLSRSYSFRNKATRYFTGSAGQQRVSKDLFTHYLCPIPTPEERRRIATILSTVDTAIAATEEVIAKTEELKRGLMRDLLMKGIDEDRRVRSEETHEFCKKQGVRVPVEWRVAQLKDVISEKLQSGYSGCETDESDGIRALTLTAVTESRIDISNTKYVKADPERVKDLFIRRDDIFIERSNTLELVGLAALYGGEESFAIYPDLLIRARAKSDLILPKILLENILHPRSRTYFWRSAKGTSGSMKKIDQKIIGNLYLSLPPLPEQHRIAAVLSAVDHDLAAEREHRARLQTLKRGLVQDLLTGRKRVPLNGGEAHGA